MSNKLILLVIATLALCETTYAAKPQYIRATQSDSVQVLFVGNSYTQRNNLPRLFQSLAESIGVKMAPSRALKGGQTLKGHLQNNKLKTMLAGGGFNYVVLQEASYRPSYPTRYVVDNVYPYAHSLDSLAKTGSPGVKVIYYMTWGHKNGLVHHKTDYPLDDTYEMMQNRLKTSYLEMTHENNSWCAPVGIAWQRVRNERPDIDLYVADQHHPSVAGSYLAANVILTTIIQKSYESEFFHTLPEETARYLQKVAQETVLDNLELIGIGTQQDNP
ncbi:DUF4886 domain-containing protein [uncultured Muribaculum sp.]|uniref:DUF4886 domain-containing protein n=1 Tax=uncultured Muribaculum sp. TaxID=1918613 RepID=UPI0025B1E532|nr:DUF4886 domain-containing protein [uncultured Muribaculum sp.]